MPKRARNRPDKNPNALVLWIESRTGKQHGVMQKDLAEAIGLSPPAFSIRMKNGRFDYSEIVKIFDYLDATDTERLIVTKGGAV